MWHLGCTLTEAKKSKSNLFACIGFFLGAIGSYAVFSYYLQYRLIHRDSFEELGCFWILIKTVWYGTIVACFGFCLGLPPKTSRQKQALPLYLLSICLVLLDFKQADNLGFKRSPLDKATSYAGFCLEKALIGYKATDDLLPNDLSPVIPPNTTLKAKTPLGEIEITSGNGLKRTVKWDCVSATFSLVPDRRQSPIWLCFPDEQTIENPEPKFERFFWNLHKGYSMCSYGEVTKNFNSIEEAVQYIESIQCRTEPFVYNNKGLAIGWSGGINPDEITISIRQILINNHLPTRLPGAQDDLIDMSTNSAQLKHQYFCPHLTWSSTTERPSPP
jgi:hypothetical protein